MFQNVVPATIFLMEVDQRNTFLTQERTVTLGRGLASSGLRWDSFDGFESLQLNFSGRHSLQFRD